MSEDNTPVESVDVDLDTFATDFFGRKEEAVESSQEDVPSDDVEDTEQKSDALEEAHTEDDTLADEDEDQEEGEVDTNPKPKRNRFQERIDEAVGKQRETERKLQAALAELAAAKGTDKVPESTPTPKAQLPLSPDFPDPLDKNEDGTDKYPLGEFDPLYLRDIAVQAYRQEREAEEKTRAQQAEEAKIEAEKAELATNWNEKLGPAKERYPDFDEKGSQLEDTFANIDQGYGEYLAATLMAMDYGPDVLYYLSNNLDEAAKIVNSGPTKAVIALGRLEARFAVEEEEKETPQPRVSKAPPPPGVQNKGTSVSRGAVKGDEDDLDSFANSFFKRR